MKKTSYLSRHLREGMNNFKRNGLMTVTSVSSLAFMLFLVGATCILLINLNQFTSKVEKDVEIHVYLKNTTASEMNGLSQTIKSLRQVTSIQFISKDQGLKSFMKNLGDEGAAFQTLEHDNPLNNEFIVKTVQPQDVTAIADRIEAMPYVDKVEYAQNVVAPLIKTTNAARMIGIIFIVILTLIAAHLVTNTIKITVLARKEEIKLRKLIGATNYFIRFPFFIEGSFIGLLGAAIACIFVVIGYYLVYISFSRFTNIDFIQLIVPFPLTLISCIILLVFGALIGIWGANSSLRRLLKV